MSLLKRVIGKKGISGVIVALLLILIGVLAVVGINTFITDTKDDLIQDANTSLQTVTQ